MAKGINPALTTCYVLEEDRKLPLGEQSKFHIHPLPAKIQYRVQDESFALTGDFQGADEQNPESAKAQTVSVFMGRTEMTTLVHGIERIENYQIPMKDGTSKELDWDDKTSAAKREERLSNIDPKHRAELSKAIRGISALTEEQEKN